MLSLLVGVGRGRASLDSLLEVAHAKEDERLADVGLDERRVDRDRRVGVLEGLRESGELGVGSRAVVVRLGIRRKTLDGLSVRLDGRDKVTLLEEVVALVPCDLGLLGRDVSGDVGVLLLLLGLRSSSRTQRRAQGKGREWWATHGTKLLENVRGPVLGEGLLIELDGVREVVLLLV